MGVETDSRRLAAALDVSENDVVEMERRLAASEMSLDAPVRSEGLFGRTQGDLVPAGPGARPDLQVENGEFQELLRVEAGDVRRRPPDRELHIFRSACSPTSRRRWSRLARTTASAASGRGSSRSA